MEDLRQLKSFLQKSWSPAVAVVASPDADEMCWTCTGLTVAELLHPFGSLKQLNSGMGGTCIVHFERAAACTALR